MEKLKMHSPNMTEQNIERLAALFPQCVTESQDAQGKIKRAIDFDLLRQELSAHLVEEPQERYQLNWPGKREALLTANAPIAKTLRPCRAESVDFDTTQNLFIEGDNLDALKLLQETYLGKVKMIYIDPPYNTGKDFIYKDNFAESSDSFLIRTHQKDEVGVRFEPNPETSGRFHSDWLSMMYSRLKLARNLLRNDGVIFISIDDNEIGNLKKICSELFGEHGFISNFVWEKRTNRENRKIISYRHDNILCYCKGDYRYEKVLKQLPMDQKALSSYKNLDNDPRGLWKSDPATAQAGHGTKSQFYEFVAPNGKVHKLESGRCWLYTKPVMEEAIKDNRIWFGKDGNGVPRVKTYLESKDRGLTPETIMFAKDVSTNESAKNDLKSLFDGFAVFETPKPLFLLKRFIQIGTNENDIVLDFFAGVSTTAHAAMQLNAEDGGNRKFIMVQLPEVCDEKSEAFKAGYPTIAEISKERIRRAGQKIKADHANKPGIDQLDIGFRVLKVDSSNMKDVYYRPDQMGQATLFDQVDVIKDDRTAEDLLFQVMLELGVELTLPIHSETLAGHTIYCVDDNAIVACFDDAIDDHLVRAMADKQPLRAVFRDAGFADDSAKINATQIFKQFAPHSELRTL